jgi:hypothetical protein
MEDCVRAYCGRHRMLYRTCETAVRTMEGDRDVVGGLNWVYEMSGLCPRC